jgi:hypothetical protein
LPGLAALLRALPGLAARLRLATLLGPLPVLWLLRIAHRCSRLYRADGDDLKGNCGNLVTARNT